jgi:hypothetical protein
MVLLWCYHGVTFVDFLGTEKARLLWLWLRSTRGHRRAGAVRARRSTGDPSRSIAEQRKAMCVANSLTCEKGNVSREQRDRESRVSRQQCEQRDKRGHRGRAESRESRQQ